jgi:hypothetical protein
VNEYELYLLSPQAPPWRVEGLLYFYLRKNKIYTSGRENGRKKQRGHEKKNV